MHTRYNDSLEAEGQSLASFETVENFSGDSPFVETAEVISRIPATENLLPGLLPTDPMPVPPTGPIPFAPYPGTGCYWPIVSSNAKGREVAYKRNDGTIVGNASRMFLATRSDGDRYHAAVDLYSDHRDVIVACENGIIVNFYHFYRGTYALLIEHDNLVINYGEVDKDSLSVHHLKVGDRVSAGQPIGLTGKMYTSSMLHFETYTKGTKSNKRYTRGGAVPKELLNPTKYLLYLQQYGRTGSGSSAPPGPSSSSYSISNMSSVVAQNRRFAESLGWGAYIYEINELLLKVIGRSGVSLGEEAFAEAVLAWQRQQGFAAKDCDGILGPQTWGKMQPLIITDREFTGRDDGANETFNEAIESLTTTPFADFSVIQDRETSAELVETLLEDPADYETDTTEYDPKLQQEFPVIYPERPGISPFALQSNRQWSRIRDGVKPGPVYGLVVHTSGGSLPGKAIAAGKYPTVYAADYYYNSTGCNYINGWKGIMGGDLVQVAGEEKKAYGVGMSQQLSSIDKGNFATDLPAAALAHWRRRWPGYASPAQLLPGVTDANAVYVHVECLPVVYYLNNRTVIDTVHPPMRPGLRFTKAQHDSIAILAYDMAFRNNWDMKTQWWRTPRLLGHEDLTPLNRHDCSLTMNICSTLPRAKFDQKECWDPGGLRANPYIDWEYIYQQIEAINRGGYEAVLSAPVQIAPELSGLYKSHSVIFTGKGTTGAAQPTTPATVTSATTTSSQLVQDAIRLWGDKTTIAGYLEKIVRQNLSIDAKLAFSSMSKTQQSSFQAEWARVRTEILKGRKNLVLSGNIPPLGGAAVPFGFYETSLSGNRGLGTFNSSNQYLASERVDKVLADLHSRGKISITQDELDLCQRVANAETYGMIQLLNSYDRGIVSIGFMQLTLHVGKIQRWIRLNEAAFRRFGLELDPTVEYNINGEKHPSIKGVSQSRIDELRWNGWTERFYYAGLDPDVIAAEATLAKAYFTEHLNSLRRRLADDAVHSSFVTNYYNRDPYIRGLFQASFNNNPARSTQCVRLAVSAFPSPVDSATFTRQYTKVLSDNDWSRLVSNTATGATVRIGATVTPEVYSDNEETSATNTPTKDWCGIRSQITYILGQAELDWIDPWTPAPNGHQIAEGERLPDGTYRMIDYLEEYWKAVEGTGRVPNYKIERPRDLATASARNTEAWSAAFVSWVLQQSGVTEDDGFVFARRHIVYIVQALSNAKRNDTQMPVHLKDVNTPVEAGDILCFNVRPAAGAAVTDYTLAGLERYLDAAKNVRNLEDVYGSSHCDVVKEIITEGGRRYAVVVGGNKSAGGSDGVTVAARNIEVDANNVVINPGSIQNPHGMFAVIKLGQCVAAPQNESMNLSDELVVENQLAEIPEPSLI